MKYKTLDERLNDTYNEMYYNDGHIVENVMSRKSNFFRIDEMGLRSPIDSYDDLDNILKRLYGSGQKFPIELSDGSSIYDYNDLLDRMRFEWSNIDEKDDILLANTEYTEPIVQNDKIYSYDFFYSYNSNHKDKDLNYLKFSIFRYLLKNNKIDENSDLYNGFIDKVISYLKKKVKRPGGSLICFIHLHKLNEGTSLTRNISKCIQNEFKTVPIIDFEVIKNKWENVNLDESLLKYYLDKDYDFYDEFELNDAVTSVMKDFNKLKFGREDEDFKMKDVVDKRFRPIFVKGKRISITEVRSFIYSCFYIDKKSEKFNQIAKSLEKKSETSKKVVFFVIDDIGTTGTTLINVEEELDIAFKLSNKKYDVEIIKLAIIDM